MVNINDLTIGDKVVAIIDNEIKDIIVIGFVKGYSTNKDEYDDVSKIFYREYDETKYVSAKYVFKNIDSLIISLKGKIKNEK